MFLWWGSTSFVCIVHIWPSLFKYSQKACDKNCLHCNSLQYTAYTVYTAMWLVAGCTDCVTGWLDIPQTAVTRTTGANRYLELGLKKLLFSLYRDIKDKQLNFSARLSIIAWKLSLALPSHQKTHTQRPHYLSAHCFCHHWHGRRCLGWPASLLSSTAASLLSPTTLLCPLRVLVVQTLIWLAVAFCCRAAAQLVSFMFI